MAGRSSRRANTFSRGRLAVGLVLVTLVAAAAMFALSELRGAPDPGSLVYAARQGVFSHDLESGDERKLIDFSDEVEVAVPSPDGRWVGYAHGQGEVWLASLTDDRRIRVADRLSTPLGWSPDGRFIVGELLSDRDLVAVDPEGGREVLMSGGYASGSLPVWIDDDTFAIGTEQSRFVIMEGGDRSDPIAGAPLAASADGAQLMLVRSGKVHIADVADGGLGETNEVFDDAASFGASSLEGYAAVTTEDGVFVFEGGTRSRRVLDRRVDWLGWARAGRVLLYAHDGAAFAKVLPDGESKRITPPGADVFPVLAFAVVP